VLLIFFKENSFITFTGPTFYFQNVPEDYLKPFYDKLHITCRGTARNEDERYPREYPEILYTPHEQRTFDPDAIRLISLNCFGFFEIGDDIFFSKNYKC
jgi:hypothetical protein